MTERPWSTMPVTGAQHRQWMEEEKRVADNFCRPSPNPLFPHPRCSQNCQYAEYWDRLRAQYTMDMR